MNAIERIRKIRDAGYTGPAVSTLLDICDEQQAEIERLKQQLKYQEHRDGRIGTHAEGCYSFGPSHYECALREIARLGYEASESEGRNDYL